MERLDLDKRLRLTYRFLPSSDESDSQSAYFSVSARGNIIVKQALGDLSGTTFRLFVDALDSKGNVLSHSSVLVTVE